MPLSNKPIYVTQPSLASLEDLVEELQTPWNSGVLTHNGPLVQEFEKKLSNKLGINDFVTVTNGTLALQLAIKSLGLKGEIITTPFSWIATISAIKWEGCTPVFCDIDPETFNIDVNKIEEKINKNTVAIMPVHVFGNPCDIDGIQTIADKYNLKVIYDAAHAVGSQFKGNSILNYGDISATSLHATKILNCGEGGGCVSSSKELNEKLRRIRFFGHDNNKEIVEDGLNGKITEIHAALGLVNLRMFDVVLDDRKRKYNQYMSKLSINNKLSFQKLNKGTNYSYFAVIFNSESDLILAIDLLEKNNYFPRRYFYPSLNTMNEIVEYKEMPCSEDISKRILCLPLYLDLEDLHINNICNLINTI